MSKQQIIEVLRTVLDEEHAQAVYDHRRAKKAAQTPYAARLIAKELAKCDDPNAAADHMILKDWKGFDADWMPPSIRKPPAANDHSLNAATHRWMTRGTNGRESQNSDFHNVEFLPAVGQQKL